VTKIERNGMQVTVVDLGGTHVRFALADISGGCMHSMERLRTLKVSNYANFQDAWRDYAVQSGATRSRAAAIALAGPVDQDPFKLTNNPWEIRASTIGEELEVEDVFVINDFGAIGHAVAYIDPSQLIHICGPDRQLPDQGVTSIVGPGTGLGTAQLIRRNGSYEVVECEGGHTDFAPLDEIDDFLLQRQRKLYSRVSVERIVSGPGLKVIYEALAELACTEVEITDVDTLWSKAIRGEDPLAASALERFCLILGSAVGDIALTQGASAVVLAGGISPRISDFLRSSGFFERFKLKGRFANRMVDIPVRLIIHPQPGLFGAAAAFAKYSVASSDPSKAPEAKICLEGATA
jgi:glucokinase